MGFRETIKFSYQCWLAKRVSRKSPQRIEQIGRERLEKLVTYARTHSEFWRDKLSGIKDGSFALSDLPTCNKTELMQNFDRTLTVDDVRRDELASFMEDISNVGKFFRGKYAVSRTSGSQGQPLLLVQTKELINLLFALHLSRGNNKPIRLPQAIDRVLHPARLAVVIFKPGFYASASAFSYLPQGAKRYMNARVFSWHDEDLFEQLNEFRPTHLTAYSSMLHIIGREIEAGRFTFQPELEQVVNIAEKIMPQARKHYTKVFGAPVLDNYAMGECLFLSNCCANGGGMHVNADWALMEVVDEHNRPVPAGQKGAKVLLTNLANNAQPLIRYEIGDIVTMAAEHCNCGSDLPLIESIDGRDSDMFKIETERGTRFLQPIVFQFALSRMLDVREYQVIQETNNRLRLLLEPLPGQKLDRERAIEVVDDELRKNGFDQQIDVEIEAVERLTPDGDNKFQRVICKTSNGASASPNPSLARK